jgi:hypothetical protein
MRGKRRCRLHGGKSTGAKTKFLFVVVKPRSRNVAERSGDSFSRVRFTTTQPLRLLPDSVYSHVRTVLSLAFSVSVVSLSGMRTLVALPSVEIRMIHVRCYGTLALNAERASIRQIGNRGPNRRSRRSPILESFARPFSKALYWGATRHGNWCRRHPWSERAGCLFCCKRWTRPTHR